MRPPSPKNLSNLAALTCIQVSNALIPVLIFPFALHMIGAAAYADLVIAEAVSFIVLAAVLFGFEIDGVAYIVGLDRETDREKLSEALCGIVAARLLLFGVSAALVIAGYAITTSHSPVLLALWLLVPLAQVFHCYWFYQGMESNLPAAAITLTSRLTSVAVVYLMVTGPEDQVLVPLAIGVPFVAGGILSFAYICVTFRIRFRWPGLGFIWGLIRHGKEVFAGNIAVMLYRDFNVILLGLAGAGADGIAAYSLAEKVVKMLQATARPLNQFFFPRLLRAIKSVGRPSRAVIRTIARVTLPQLGAVATLLLLLVPGYVLATAYVPAVSDVTALPQFGAMLAIMAPATLFGVANFTFGVTGLNYLGARLYLFKAIMVTGIASASACLLLATGIGALGAAICFTAAEALLLVLVLNQYVRTGDSLRSGGRTGDQR